MKIKKILILGSNESFSIEKMYERAFRSIGVRTNFIHVYDIKKNIFSKIFWKYMRFFYFFFIRIKIINYIKHNNTYDLIVIFKGLYLKKGFISQIKKISKNCKFINIFTDNPFDIRYFKDISNKNILDSIPEFDHLYIYSKNILKKLRSKYPGNIFSYLPFAHDTFVHKKKKEIRKKEYDISFIGTADNTRYEFIKKLKNLKIIIAGNGWKKFKLDKNINLKSSVNSNEYSSIINNSLVSLNLLRNQNVDSHNMKTFEIPSMGGLLLTKKNKDQNQYFPENHACIMFKSVNDIRSILNYIKNNPKKYELIKKEGYKAAKKHSYINRARLLIKTLHDK